MYRLVDLYLSGHFRQTSFSLHTSAVPKWLTNLFLDSPRKQAISSSSSSSNTNNNNNHVLVIGPFPSPRTRRRRRGSGLPPPRARRDHLRGRDGGRRARVCRVALHPGSVAHLQGRPDPLHAAFPPRVRRLDAGQHRQVRRSHAGTGRGHGEARERDFGIGLLRFRGMFFFFLLHPSPSLPTPVRYLPSYEWGFVSSLPHQIVWESICCDPKEKKNTSHLVCVSRGVNSLLSRHTHTHTHDNPKNKGQNGLQFFPFFTMQSGTAGPTASGKTPNRQP